MTKHRRSIRPTAANKAKRKTPGSIEASRQPLRCAEFQRQFTEGGDIQTLAKQMGIAQRTAYKWARYVKLTIAEHLERICSRAEFAAMVHRHVMKTRNGTNTRGNALTLEGKMRDAFPEPMPPQTVSPITLIFNRVDLTKKESYATHEIGFSRSIQDESQGNAGSGTSESAITRSGIRDPTKSGREKE